MIIIIIIIIMIDHHHDHHRAAVGCLFYTFLFLFLFFLNIITDLLLSLFFSFNLHATKLFIVTSATKGGGGGYHPLRFSVRFKILYRVIQPLIQHCLLRKMVYLNIIYVLTTRNYEVFTTGIVP